MTTPPAGLHLCKSAKPLPPSYAHAAAPVDLPPPPPELDPREPAAPRRGRQTPQKARTPTGSRTASPSRPSNPRSTSSDNLTPVQSPIPRTLSPHSASHSPVPIQPIPYPAAATIGHHLSRPNSPSNSVHSSSSAIFERDIEALPVGALSLNPNAPTQTLNHKSSRLSHGSTLEQTVPAVLDDAVEALQGTYTSRDIKGLEIEAPTAGVGMARTSSASLANIGPPRKVSSTGAIPMGSSRSPSPGSASPAQSPPILSQLSTQSSFGAGASGGVSPTSPTGTSSPPAGGFGGQGRTSAGPQVPGGWRGEEAHTSSPLAAPPAAAGIPQDETSPTALTPSPAIPSHLSPSKDKRRISFISYNDLLLSVPTTVTNLGEITSGALSPEHLPGTVSPSMSTRSPVIAAGFSSAAASPPAGGPGMTGSPLTPEAGGLAGLHKPSWDAGSPARGGLGFEGEWQREGLGKGLEQRLEDLVQHSQ